MLQNSVVNQLSSKPRVNTIAIMDILSTLVFNVVSFHCLNRYYDTYVPFLLEACNDENPDVRQACPWTLFMLHFYFLLKFSWVIFRVKESFFYFQAAVYGIGVCAEFGGSNFKPLVGGIIFMYIYFFWRVPF